MTPWQTTLKSVSRYTLATKAYLGVPRDVALTGPALGGVHTGAGCVMYLACMGALPFDKDATSIDDLRANLEQHDLTPVPKEIYGSELVRPHAPARARHGH